jgi:hypothetical protein
LHEKLGIAMDLFSSSIDATIREAFMNTVQVACKGMGVENARSALPPFRMRKDIVLDSQLHGDLVDEEIYAHVLHWVDFAEMEEEEEKGLEDDEGTTSSNGEQDGVAMHREEGLEDDEGTTSSNGEQDGAAMHREEGLKDDEGTTSSNGEQDGAAMHREEGLEDDESTASSNGEQDGVAMHREEGLKDDEGTTSSNGEQDGAAMHQEEGLEDDEGTTSSNGEQDGVAMHPSASAGVYMAIRFDSVTEKEDFSQGDIWDIFPKITNDMFDFVRNEVTDFINNLFGSAVRMSLINTDFNCAVFVLDDSFIFIRTDSMDFVETLDVWSIASIEYWWISETMLQVVPFNSRASVASFVSGDDSPEYFISFPALHRDDGWSTVIPAMVPENAEDKEKVVAFMGALHTRLGNGSLARHLDVDVIRNFIVPMLSETFFTGKDFRDLLVSRATGP